MVTGVLASARGVNVDNGTTLSKVEIASVNDKEDGEVCVGSATLIVEEDEESITIIEIVEMICVFF